MIALYAVLLAIQLFVRIQFLSRIFFYCPACGCAWTSPPPPWTVDSIEAIGVYAPKGIELPTRADIVASGLEQAIERTPDYGEWGSSLQDVLAACLDNTVTLNTFSLHEGTGPDTANRFYQRVRPCSSMRRKGIAS